MALNIEVNEDYRIKSDSINVVVERKYIVDPTKAPNWSKRQAEGADPTPRAEWRESSYHTTVDKALQWVVNQQIRDSDAGSLAELAREIRRIHVEIKALMRR